MSFDDFWRNFPHPRPPHSRGSKATCKLYWNGQRKTATTVITPDMHEVIEKACRIYRENTRDLEQDRFPMCQTWMYQERWETVIEGWEEQEAREAELTEERREQVRRAEFARAFKAWSDAQRRMPGEPKPTVEEFLAQREPQLRVVK